MTIKDEGTSDAALGERAPGPRRPMNDGVATERRVFHSVAEAARLLGTSEMTLYRAIQDGQFPAVRIRGRLIIPAKAIEAMVDAAVDGHRMVDTAEWTGDGDR